MPGKTHLAGLFDGSPAFVAAKLIDDSRKDVSFADALVLARLVLDRDGGPVPTRGKRAFTDAVTARRLARLELAELDEGRGRSAGTVSKTAWTLSASELGCEVVQSALETHRLGQAE